MASRQATPLYCSDPYLTSSYSYVKKLTGLDKEGQMGRLARTELPALIVGLLLIAFGLFPLAAPAVAGQGAAAAASIVGQVTDGTGAVLPGVTVTATSPPLLVT